MICPVSACHCLTVVLYCVVAREVILRGLHVVGAMLPVNHKVVK
jgi:hypothetical protein